MAHSHQPVAILTMTRGPGVGSSFDIGSTPVTIGREASCDFQVQGTWVSRKHARIAWSGTEYLIDDLGSTNGTFVNGERISGSRALRSGDRLQLGTRVELGFEMHVPAAQPVQPVAQGTASPPYAPPSEPAPAPKEPAGRRKRTRVWVLAGVGLILVLVIAAVAYFLLSDNGEKLADIPVLRAILPEPTATLTPTPVPGGTIMGRAYLVDRDKPVRSTVLLRREVGETFKDLDSTTTDKDGYYSFRVEEAGTYRVEISVMDLLDTCDNLRTESGGWGSTRVFKDGSITDVRASSRALSVTLDGATTVDCELYCD